MGPYGRQVKQRILQMSFEDVAGHKLGRRHVLQSGLGEDFSCHLRLCQLHQETVFRIRVHFEGVAQTHLLFGNVCQHCKLLVDELRCRYRVRCFDSIVGREVIILAGVEDDAAVADDYAGHVLIDQRSLHVDVSEQDAVDGVVQHNVQTL